MSDISLYYYLNDSLEGKMVPTQEDYQETVQKFLSIQILSDEVKKEIIAKIDPIIDPLIKNGQNSEESAKDKKELLQSIDLLNDEQSITKLIRYLEESINKNDSQMINGILDKMIRLNREIGTNVLSEFLKLVTRIFENEHDSNVYHATILFLQSFQQNSQVESYLVNHNRTINNKIIKTNQAETITLLAKTYFKTSDKMLFTKYMDLLINQWLQNDDGMGKESFIQLLWYSFICEKDEQFVNSAKKSSFYLKEDDPEIGLYRAFKNTNNGIINPTSGKEILNSIITGINSFDQNETNRILNVMNKRMDQMIKDSNKKHKPSNHIVKQLPQKELRKMAKVTRLPSEEKVLPGTKIKLQEEWIELITYKRNENKELQQYIKVKVLSHNGTGKAYVTSSEIQEINQKKGKNSIMIVDFNEKSPSQQIQIDQPFVWPSTEIKGNTDINLQENSLLHEESELKKIGYQITGLNREKRWSLLEKAVKQIGLKSVVYTIAQNVKLRKGQKNGEIKYKYAITEWEYDLAKLKKHFFRNDFYWPSTKVTNGDKKIR